jgi:hypothetical protein
MLVYKLSLFVWRLMSERNTKRKIENDEKYKRGKRRGTCRIKEVYTA